MFVTVAVLRYQALVRSEQETEAARFGREMVEGRLADLPSALNGLAWSIVSPSEPLSDAPDLELAALAIERADAVTDHGDASILDTLARVHWMEGRTELAIETQRRALERSPDEWKEQMQATLATYEAGDDA